MKTCPLCGESHSDSEHFENIILAGPERVKVTGNVTHVIHSLNAWEEVTLSVALKVARAVALAGIVNPELAAPFRTLELRLAEDLERA